MLLGDFHIHTRFSDGLLSLGETVDLFGQAGFDAIAVTDHVVDDSGLSRLSRGLGCSVTPADFPSYLGAIRGEAARAWERYRMLVIPGVEISRNSLREGDAAHLLLLGVREFVPASWEIERICDDARRQGAVVVACHPHRTTSRTDLQTLHLWNNRGRYAPWIDAWEVANRDDLFTVVSAGRLPYVANSDFHRPAVRSSRTCT